MLIDDSVGDLVRRKAPIEFFIHCHAKRRLPGTLAYGLIQGQKFDLLLCSVVETEVIAHCGFAQLDADRALQVETV